MIDWLHAADLEVGGVFMRVSREVHKRLTGRMPWKSKC
jgi:hypothetical protein